MTSKRRRSKAISHEVAEVVSQHFQERKVGTPLDHANLIEHEAKKVAPTSTEQLPVVITEERRNVKELTLFEVGLLPFLYLEAAVKYVFNYINERYPLK